VEDDAGILVVSGLPGVGKSTLAAALAHRLPRAAHIEADDLPRMIVSGGEWPGVDPATGEAERQLRLRLHNACVLARSFREAGFMAIVDDIVAGPRFADLVEDLDGIPFGFVMLVPGFEHVKARWRAMDSPFVDQWDWIDTEIRERTPRVGLWLDTTSLSINETVDTVIARLDEAEVR
jgi:hypothetical protein